jgi:short subunit fatty acids transporter
VQSIYRSQITDLFAKALLCIVSHVTCQPQVAPFWAGSIVWNTCEIGIVTLTISTPSYFVEDEVEEQSDDEIDKNEPILDKTAGIVAVISVSEPPNLSPLVPN